jgi:hypothetical protein
LSRLSRSALNRARHLNTRVRLTISSLNAGLIIARVSVAHFRTKFDAVALSDP